MSRHHRLKGDEKFPLERKLTARFLCAVHRQPTVIGITTGVIPASATTGMLLGYGIRSGGAGRVFSAIGSLLVSARNPSFATLTGFLLHLALMLLCGILYASLVDRAKDHPFSWAIAIGAAVAAISLVLVRAFGGPIALVLTPANLVAVGVVIALTLPIGMRFAPSRL
jgi:hypothetical protein